MEGFSNVEVESPVIQKLRKTIAESPAQIEVQYAKSGNTWPDCVHTRVAILNGQMFLLKKSPDYTPQKYAVLQSNFEKLSERLEKLREEYKKNKKRPPQEVQDELLEMLHIL
ncbi:hypothetical protein A2917_00110 [Candidatus Nomurabacteria bacterium RIFCSPLOWO2_01_FULL_42_17]|uniref:Uncharacterized protein n=1 Tax=Candidatus Nomurabacteria bacterium RIFCSPLOWO2_01_FULL_42_17 TaxID=1801780 RepID=A0A1F6XNK9_9BACT|nr:MAG: hypothetical protein A2917_00110 [Candidatus Nomurabacteria bacterium RIFCSPLOWO2_01_FULL_42_17]